MTERTPKRESEKEKYIYAGHINGLFRVDTETGSHSRAFTGACSVSINTVTHHAHALSLRHACSRAYSIAAAAKASGQ